MSIISQIKAERNEKIVKEALNEMITDNAVTNEMMKGAKELQKKLEAKGMFSE